VTFAARLGRQGTLLAVLGRDRRPDFPDIPLLKEIYPRSISGLWFAIFAPPVRRPRL